MCDLFQIVLVFFSMRRLLLTTLAVALFGVACAEVRCDLNSNTSFSYDDKILVLVLEKSTNTASSIKDIANNFLNLVKAMNAKSDKWITTYVLQTVSPSGSVDNFIVFRDPDDVVDYLNQFAKEAEKVPGSCKLDLRNALDSLFSSSIPLKGAQVLIISSATPQNADQRSMMPIVKKYSDNGAPTINYVHVDSTCNDLAAMNEIYWFIQGSGGTILSVQPQNISELFIAFLPNLYGSQMILLINREVYLNMDGYTITVDAEMSEVFVAVGGIGASISAINRFGDNIKTTPLFASDQQSLWKLDTDSTTSPDIHVSFSSDSPFCFPTFYGYGGAQMFVGFIQDNNTADSPLPYAVKGKENFPVFHFVNNVPDFKKFSLTHSYIFAHPIEGSDVTYDIYIDFRSDCSYEYVGKGFTCGGEDESLTLYAVQTARLELQDVSSACPDYSGHDDYIRPFERFYMTWCLGDETVSTSTPTSFTAPVTTTSRMSASTVKPTENPSEPQCGEYSLISNPTDYKEPCFNVYTNPLSWEHAQSKCASEFGPLVTINSLDENKFFWRTAMSSNLLDGIHIGAHQSKETPSQWTWVDGEIPIDGTIYDNFISAFPIPGGGECSAMLTENTNALWINEDCIDNELPFICRRNEYSNIPKECPTDTPKAGDDIFPPGFPDPETPCEYILFVAAQKLVELEVLTLVTEVNKDFLEILEGPAGPNLLANLTGSVLSPIKFKTEKSNIMRVNWKPNGSGIGRGFRIRYNEVAP